VISEPEAVSEEPDPAAPTDVDEKKKDEDESRDAS
jgi:hypothetical protein